MSRLALLLLIPLAVSTPAMAQGMDHSSMPGMTMPMPAPTTKAPPRKPTPPSKRRHKPKRHHTHHHAAAQPPSQMPGMTTSPATPGPQTGGDHDMSSMPGMPMQSPGAPSGADMPGMPGMAPAQPAPASGAMAGMDMSATGQADQGAMSTRDEPEIPKTPPPPAPTDHAADRFFDPGAMANARGQLRLEHGGSAISKVMVNLAEFQPHSGGDYGYRWEGEAWIGGDINRFVFKSEGEGTRRRGVDSAEVQGLYSRAIGPYWNLQAGVRQDFEPRSRTYATVGVEGLAPYWFDLQGALFLSTRGDVLARVEGTYDLRLTQRFILQPRAELNFAAQDTPETLTGSGLSNAELGLRLRYEVRREFAPYIGVSYDRRFGRTADYRRAAGEDVEDTSVVIGIRAFF